jgi:acyl-CoA thioester hydrolase
MYVNKYEFKVRYAEVDRMNIAYHSNYIIWFELGRTEFLRSLGYNYSQLEKEEIWLPVIEVGCKYMSPVTYDDRVVVETFIEELSRVRIKFKYRLYTGGRLCAEGFSAHAFTNPKLRPLALNKVKPDVYNKLIECTK